MERTIGRVLIVADMEVKAETALAIASLAKDWADEPQTTFIAGVNRSVILAHGSAWPQVFYNAFEFLPLMDVLGLMPWMEIWVVSAGRTWKAGPMMPRHTSAKGRPALGQAASWAAGLGVGA